MSTTSAGITELESSQSQKEVTINEAFNALSSLLVGVISLGDTTPPGSPSNGDAYILGSSPTGAWASKGKNIAYYYGGWKFLSPVEGMKVWVNDLDLVYNYDGSDWILSPGSFSTLGVNSSENNTSSRLAVEADSVKLLAETDDMQLFLNKVGATDNLELLFQQNFNTRASMGLLSNTDFTCKVSTDGSVFTESFVINDSDGIVDFKEGVKFQGGTDVLDFYEEGDFTPLLTFGGGSTGITYTNQLGKYVRIGKIIHFSLRITLSSKGTSTGSAVISGLPYYPSSFPYYGHGITIQSTAMTALGDNIVSQVTNSGNLNMVTLSATTTATVQDTNFTNTSNLIISGSAMLL